MKCNNCKKTIPNNVKFCPHCGAKINKQYNQTQTENKPAGCWRTFNSVGYGLSIAGLALFWFPIVGWCFSIPGFVFACLGKRDIANKEKQKKSFSMGLAGIILNFIVFLVLVIVIPVVIATRK